jgi:hypothetical protein
MGGSGNGREIAMSSLLVGTAMKLNRVSNVVVDEQKSRSPWVDRACASSRLDTVRVAIATMVGSMMLRHGGGAGCCACHAAACLVSRPSFHRSFMGDQFLCFCLPNSLPSSGWARKRKVP